MRFTITRNSWIALSIAFLLVGLLSRGNAGQKKGQDPVAQFCSYWETQSKVVESVRYVITGTRTVAQGYFGPFSPQEDYRFTRRVLYLLDFKNNRMKKEREEQQVQGDYGRFSPFFETFLTDGKNHKYFYPRDKNTSDTYKPSEQIADLNERSDEGLIGYVLPEDWAVFLAHGSVPTNKMRPEANRLQMLPVADDFQFHGNDSVGGRACAIFRSPNHEVDGEQHEYWVDINRGGLVVRHMCYFKKTPVSTCELHYKASGKSWTLSGWTYKMHGKGKVVMLDEMQVRDVELNPVLTIDQFQMSPKPGMRVTFKDKKGIYQVLDDGSFKLINKKNGPTH